MKKNTILGLLLIVTSLTLNYSALVNSKEQSSSLVSPSTVSTPEFGTLTIEQMTQGQLLWLKGRVGEGSYTFTDQNQQDCSVKVPVAIGGFAQPDLAVKTTKGLTIVVVSQQLNDAILQGERINSKEWRFSKQLGNGDIDGIIANGIEISEGFVLNSKRRWISWFMGDKTSLTCL